MQNAVFTHGLSNKTENESNDGGKRCELLTVTALQPVLQRTRKLGGVEQKWKQSKVNKLVFTYTRIPIKLRRVVNWKPMREYSLMKNNLSQMLIYKPEFLIEKKKNSRLHPYKKSKE